MSCRGWKRRLKGDQSNVWLWLFFSLVELSLLVCHPLPLRLSYPLLNLQVVWFLVLFSFFLILSFSKGYLLLPRPFPLISPPGAALPSTSLLPAPLCNPSDPHSTQLLFFPHNSFPTLINPHLSPGGRPIFLTHPEGVCSLPLALRELPRLGLLGGCQAAVPFWSLLG